MVKLTAEQFRDLCDGVQDARASLASCLEREAPAESERLLKLVQELRGATLARANLELEHRRDRIIYTAMLAYSGRSEQT